MEFNVSFEHQSNKLAGSLHIPDEIESTTAVVMLQGSGPADRNNDTFFPPIRDFFLKRGISVFSYDKPGVGQSTGNWKHQSFHDRATEALKAIHALKQFEQVDFQKFGLFGHSQGGWVVFLAASLSDKIDFVISNSGPSISPMEQDLYGLVYLNRQLNVSESDIQHAVNLHGKLVDAAYQDEEFAPISNLISQHKNSAWENYFNFDQDSWIFFKKNFDYNPIPHLKKTDCPSLVLLGEADLLVPAQKCASIFQEHLDPAASRIHIFPNADHRMKVGKNKQLSPDYFDVMTKWLTETGISGY